MVFSPFCEAACGVRSYERMRVCALMTLSSEQLAKGSPPTLVRKKVTLNARAPRSSRKMIKMTAPPLLLPKHIDQT